MKNLIQITKDEDFERAQNLLKNGKVEFSIPEDKKPKASSEKDFWLIENVLVNGKIHNYKLLKDDLLEAKTQDQHVEYAKNNPNDFHIQDLPVYHAIANTVHNLPESKIKQEIKDFWKKSMKDYWLMTATGVDYYPAGKKDKVIHRIGNYSIEENIVGDDEFVKNSKNPEVYKALTGDNDLQNINNIYKGITGKDKYLRRINSKPNSLDKRVVWLDSGDGRSLFVADGDLSYSIRCFGVMED